LDALSSPARGAILRSSPFIEYYVNAKAKGKYAIM